LSQAETVVVAEEARFQKITDPKRYQHIWEPEAWGTNRIGRAIAKASWTYMGTKLGIIIWRHAVKAIYRRYIKNKKIMDIMKQVDQHEGQKEDEQKKENAKHAQFEYGKQIADGFYGRLISESAIYPMTTSSRSNYYPP
jgi:hypothetical protein